MDNRLVCYRCRRPTTVCFCDQLVTHATRTRIVFLQHPRERKVAISTARMAHLCLPNSEFHQGVDFSGHPRVSGLATAPGGATAVLFPGATSLDPGSAEARGFANLIVVDGTWSLAKKVLTVNPALAALPRIGLVPRRPGNYRIRKEPSPECLSTIEAVVEVLGALEQRPDGFEDMLRAFTYMVDRQLACESTRQGPPRHKRKRTRNPASTALPRSLDGKEADVVLVYAEANAQGPRDPTAPRPLGHAERAEELIQLVAIRPASGESVELLLRPSAALGANTAKHLEVDGADVLGGEDRAAGLERWRGFLRETDTLCAWGFYTLDLLRAEGAQVRPFVDLRAAALRKLKARPRGVEEAAELLSAVGRERQRSWARGRAGRRIAALQDVFDALRDAAAPSRRLLG